MSDHKYEAWIAENVPEDCKNLCEEVTEVMVGVFPELTRVRGHYIDLLVGRRPHWWCVTLEGEIVDPTASQFAPCGDYEPLDESKGEPTGICPNCGDGVCYDGAGVCSDRCHHQYLAYLNGV